MQIQKIKWRVWHICPEQAGQVTVRIYIFTGMLVKQVSQYSNGPSDPQNYIYWACENEEGGKVASGVYMINVVGPGISITKKVAILR